MTAFRIVRVPDANNPTVGDLWRDAAGRLALVRGIEEVAQRIFIRLNFFLGEWVHDLRQGMPWREQFFEKGASEPTKRAILLAVLQDTPGVREVVSLTLSLDRARRRQDVAFVVRTDDGLLKSEDYGPFLVALEESIAA